MTDALKIDVLDYEREQVRLDLEDQAFERKVDDALPHYLYTAPGMRQLLAEIDSDDFAEDFAAIMAAMARGNRMVLEFALERFKDRLTAEGRKLAALMVR